MAEKSGLFYPNKMARIYLFSIEEMVGPEALNAVLKLAEAFTKFSDQCSRA